MSLSVAECLVVAERADIYPKGVDSGDWYAPGGLG